MKNKLRSVILKALIKGADTIGAHKKLAQFASRFITEIDSDGKVFPAKREQQQNRYTVLVLDYARFRADIDIFAKDKNCRFLIASPTLLQHMLRSFVNAHHKKRQEGSLGERWDFANAKPGSTIYKEREGYRKFLRKFLPALYRLCGVQMIMNSDARYAREADITKVSAEIGVPHLCYYREALYIVPAHYKNAIDRHRSFGPFDARIIAVQNEVTKNTFLESGICKENQIAIRGCPRMDTFLQTINKKTANNNKRKQVAFFSAPGGAQRMDLSFFPFLDNTLSVVRTLARLAKNNPDIDVVIKMKDMHLNQVPDYEKAIKEAVGNINTVENITISTDRMAAQHIILNSDVICAYQSTVVLEAAIAGKAVILPHLKSIREQDRAEEVLMYQEYRHLFDVPEDEKELEELVIKRLHKNKIDKKTMEERRKLFEEHVSPLTSDATETSLKLIKNIIDKENNRKQAA